MRIITQKECACEFNVSKQYISKLVQSNKIKSYGDNNNVDYYEVDEFINNDQSNMNIDTINIVDIDDLKSELHLKREKYRLNNIYEDELINFIIENFHSYFHNFTLNMKIKRLSTILTYIYHYQLFQENKTDGYKKIKKNIENKINYAKRQNKNLFDVIDTFDSIPEGKIDKEYLKEIIKMMTAPLNSRLLSKDMIKKYDYKIDKILKKLPF